MLPQLRLLSAQPKSPAAKRHCSPRAAARLTCTHESAGSARVVKKCDASCCSWQQLSHLRKTDDDHAGEDATSCATSAPTTNSCATRGRRAKRTCQPSSRARGTSPRATTSRAARWRTSPSSAHISVIRHRRDAQHATRRHTAPRAPGLLHAVPRARRVAADRRLRLRRRAPGNSAGRRLDDLRAAAPADLVMCLICIPIVPGPSSVTRSRAA